MTDGELPEGPRLPSADQLKDSKNPKLERRKWKEPLSRSQVTNCCSQSRPGTWLRPETDTCRYGDYSVQAEEKQAAACQGQTCTVR